MSLQRTQQPSLYCSQCVLCLEVLYCNCIVWFTHPLFHTAAGWPTNVYAMPAGIPGFQVSWTPPTSGANVIRYRIYYNRGTDEGSTDVMAGDTSVTIKNCTWSLTYSVRIVALSNHLPSPVVGASIATFGK